MKTFRTVIICLSLLLALSGCSRFSKTPAGQSQSAGLTGENGWDPTVACAFMSDKLAPGPYKNESGSAFACLSEEKNLDPGSPANNIAYYAKGEAGRARLVGLSLKVNRPETAGAALQTFLEYSQQLSEKATGIPLSSATAKAMSAGNAGRGKVGSTKVEILKQNFPDGKGYELNFVITPTASSDYKL
jgi:hypothetical protein